MFIIKKDNITIIIYSVIIALCTVFNEFIITQDNQSIDKIKNDVIYLKQQNDFLHIKLNYLSSSCHLGYTGG